MKTNFYAIFFLLWNSSNLLNAQGYTDITVQVDQDFFNAQNDDRNYTMGLFIDYSSHDLDSCRYFAPFRNISRKSSSVLHKKYEIEFGNNNISFFFGGFTPDSIGTQSVIQGDRPFGSVACFNTGINYLMTKETKRYVAFNKEYRKTKEIDPDVFKKKRFKSRNISIALGAIGLPLGQPLQGLFHSGNEFYKDTLNYTNPMYPYGWINQISNGGGLTGLLQIGGSLLLTSNYLTRFITSPTSNKGYTDGLNDRLNYFQRHFEFKVGYQLMAGYYNKAQLNIEGRFGKINPTNWVNTYSYSSFTGDFIKQEKKPQSKRNAEFYFFGSLRGNYMAYNSLLRGQMFDFLTFGNSSNYTLTTNEVQPFFIGASLGMALRMGGFFLSYTPISIRTSELKTIDKYIRNHQWGEVRISFRFRDNRLKKYI